jgi:hypothetical protein
MKVTVYLAVTRCRASIGLNVGRQIICWRGDAQFSATNARLSTIVVAVVVCVEQPEKKRSRLVCRQASARNAKNVGLISGVIVGIFREAMFFMNPESASLAKFVPRASIFRIAAF